MPETLTKLRPDRDLQCYFFSPSAIAALSQTSPTGFTVSGSWRQQFDWTVIEWNRDNVFEHPALRNLPDGDLSGVQLSYQETRTNCIQTRFNLVSDGGLALPSHLGGSERQRGDLPSSPCEVRNGRRILRRADSSIPVAGNHHVGRHHRTLLARSTLQLYGNGQRHACERHQQPGRCDYIQSIAWPGNCNGEWERNYPHLSGRARLERQSRGCLWNGARCGNRIVAPASGLFSGGQSPAAWQITLNFANLADENGAALPTLNKVRKLRWTYSADIQTASFVRTDFAVNITNWTVTGSNLQYNVAGPGSRRIEDSALDELTYHGTGWSASPAQTDPVEPLSTSGGTIHWTSTPNDFVSASYTFPTAHSLYLGTRYVTKGSAVSVQVDGGAPVTFQLAVPGEDVQVRLLIGQFAAGAHQVTVTNIGAADTYCYFDFLEIALPTPELPDFAPLATTTLATDWDTLHSQALAPERTAWIIQKLGFQGRANHYTGALWFYELTKPGQTYASATVTFSGVPTFGSTTKVFLGPTEINHVNLIGDTPETIATAFALVINAGSTGVWAQANGAVLTITARAMGTAGAIPLSASPEAGAFTAIAGNTALANGVDGKWLTDLAAVPRINRAARDWSTAYFQALKGYGLSAATAFSMELGNGDDTVATGIAQRYPDGDAGVGEHAGAANQFQPAEHLPIGRRSMPRWRGSCPPPE